MDSSAAGIQVDDYFLADLHTEGTAYRAWARVVARLSLARAPVQPHGDHDVVVIVLDQIDHAVGQRRLRRRHGKV
mgnify:CR=1 FL=1